MCQALDPNPGKSAVNKHMNTAAEILSHIQMRGDRKKKKKELNGTLKNIVDKG